MANPCENRSGQIKAQIADVAELIIDIIAKQVQEKHIADDVHKTAVQEGISYKLPHIRLGWSEHKLHSPCSKRLDNTSTADNGIVR